MNTVWWRAALALGSILAALPACVAARPASVDQIAAFQALLRQAGVGPADTACVSVAVPGGERDPSPDVLTALRNASPSLRPVSACATGATSEPGLVRLVSVTPESNTLVVTGETVAEHLTRYECRLTQSRAPLGPCVMTGRQ